MFNSGVYNSVKSNWKRYTSECFVNEHKKCKWKEKIADSFICGLKLVKKGWNGWDVK